MYKIKLAKLFGLFNKISDLTDTKIVEMSIKKSRINFQFQDGSLIYTTTFMGLMNDSLIDANNLYLTTWENNIILTYDTTHIDIKDVPDDSLFKEFFNLVIELGEHICQCPSLEYVISSSYLKIFVDKPSMDIKSLNNIQDIFSQSYSLELSKQRPYCLFIPPFDRKVDTNISYKEKSLPGNSISEIIKAQDSESKVESNVDFSGPEVLTSDMVRKMM